MNFPPWNFPGKIPGKIQEFFTWKIPGIFQGPILTASGGQNWLGPGQVWRGREKWSLEGPFSPRGIKLGRRLGQVASMGLGQVSGGLA